MNPGLYVVGTPIGNLEDITLRALDVLRGVAVVLTEDTRHTGILLQRYEIRTPTVSELYAAWNASKFAATPPASLSVMSWGCTRRCTA